MKKIIKITSKICAALLAVLGFSALVACCKYGMPTMGYNIEMSGTVKSKTTKLPIKGIQVSYGKDFSITDEKGDFSFYTYIDYGWYMNYEDSTYRSDSIPIQFADTDGAENGYFNDTVIIINPANKDEFKIHVELSDKN